MKFLTVGIVGLVLIVGLFFGIFYLYGTNVYDGTVNKQEMVDQSWGDVQTAYQRRADLVPQLVATVKGAAENEKEILTTVTKARAGIVEAKTPEEIDLLGQQINSAIRLTFERYPNIRSTENFQMLQSQLEGTENRISTARKRYNESVQVYNTQIRGFWRSKALSFVSNDEFSKRAMFEANPGAEDAPVVDFSN